MRISDWSSDVCSSDLRGFGRLRRRSGPSLDLPLDLRLGFGLGGLLGGFLGRLLGRQLGGALGGGEGGLQLVEGGIAAGGFLNRRRGGRRGGSAGAGCKDIEAGDEAGVVAPGLPLCPLEAPQPRPAVVEALPAPAPPLRRYLPLPVA